MAVKKHAGACVFCQIISGEASAAIVLDDDTTLAFLDRSPLFLGHVLVVPKVHHETLGELPPDLVEPLFANARRLAIAVERAMKAEGTFVAMNNRISQSVPHLHVHVVPRRKGDGLRGFFWPRQKYDSEEAMAVVARAIRAEAGT
jgi:histidine triad (HIT) family protein